MALSLAAHAAAAQGWAINVYGLSYHPDGEAARRAGVDNEINPGLAARYESPGGLFAEAGAYRDSGRGTAKFAGAGYQWKLGKGWRAGGALALFKSEQRRPRVRCAGADRQLRLRPGHAQRRLLNDELGSRLERAMGIEPTFIAWEAIVLPLDDARVVC